MTYDVGLDTVKIKLKGFRVSGRLEIVNGSMMRFNNKASAAQMY